MIYRYVILICLLISMTACSNSESKEKTHLLTVSMQNYSTSLFYSGIIQPLHTTVIASPADATILDMSFQYGEEVDRDQVLFKLSSSKFLSDYKTALMQYVKAKSDFNNSQTQFSEAEFLHKNELISDDDFKTRQANYYGSRLALLQAKDVLQELLDQLNIKSINLDQLNIADIDKINKAMHLQAGVDGFDNLRLVSPAKGVVLSPSKNGEENKKLAKGDVVKQGDVLAIIGDLQGISVNVKVNELTVNQLKAGQKVKVTGIAFNDELIGEIKQVDKQAENASNGLPSFSVQIVVPQLTDKQRKEIHIGMSAKVEINLVEEAQIAIPVNALVEKNGISYVKFYDKKTNQAELTPVQTGNTSQDSVVILSGLKLGDKIVVPN